MAQVHVGVWVRRLDSCCSPLEDANLMGIMVQSSDQGFTQKGFASCWAYLAIVNPSKALEHMMYLGLPMDPALMQRQFAISKTRQQERRRGKDFQGRALFQVSLASTCVACCVHMWPLFFWCYFAVAVRRHR